MSIYAASRHFVPSAGTDISSHAEVVTLPERLDSATAPQFETFVVDRIASGSYDFILDCQNIRFLTAAGLRMILASLRAVKAVEGQLAVKHLQGQPKAMFEACGFDSLIPVLGTQDAPSVSVAAA